MRKASRSVVLAVIQVLFSFSAYGADYNPILQRMRVAVGFGSDAIGILEVEKTKDGELKGIYKFPADDTGGDPDIKKYAEWPLKEVKITSDEDSYTLSYLIPLDLIGGTDPFRVEFRGPPVRKGIINLKSDDGELHCIDADKLTCVVDMNEAFKFRSLDLAAVYKHLTKKYDVEFDISEKRAIIPMVAVEHEVVQNEVRGMIVHVEGWIFGAAERKIEVAAYFYKSDGSPIPDTDGRYNTSTGNVSVGSRIEVGEGQNIVGKDFELFIPYSQLEIPFDDLADSKMKVNAAIFDITDSDDAKQLGIIDEKTEVFQP